MRKKIPFPEKLLNGTAKVTIVEDCVSIEGEPVINAEYEGRCIYHEHRQSIKDSDGNDVIAEGTIIFKGDIAPTAASVSQGKVAVENAEFVIVAGYRPRNPDGSVHHTELLIR